MSKKPPPNKYIVFSPDLRAEDNLSNYWMRQATIRLRREICWLWKERGFVPQNDEQLPLFVDKVSFSLDLTRHWVEKQGFFEKDATAVYLTEQLSNPPPAPKKLKRGSFSWVIKELDLDDVSIFTLALALTTAFDANMGSVIATCLNDTAKIYPNLMLIQRLWDNPGEVLALADPLHPLFSFGLLGQPAGAAPFYAETFWEQPLTVPTLVARQLFSAKDIKTQGLSLLEPKKVEKVSLTKVGKLSAHRLKTEKDRKLRVVPLLGAKGTNFRETVATISRLSEKNVLEFTGDASLLENKRYLNSLVALCWLQGRYLFIKTEIDRRPEKQGRRNEGLPLVSIPATLFLSITERRQIDQIAPEVLLPIIEIPTLTYAERIQIWQQELGKKALKYKAIIGEIARRFRYEKETIREICRELRTLPNKLTVEDFIAACRAELNFDIGELAVAVEPRFHNEKLILPYKQDLQFKEQLEAMRSLTEVHYGWGTARAWNEGGITVLYAGPSGTGKTMAAEIMALKLNLPMYRVDLSQVVNKYIGETEKNLKRIFDVADISDMVLFFDEADALFGKRMDASDPRDRYANLEISYLLERMERYKGLAILATNRKQDLDQAFLRRLRYIIDFPLPGEEQRKHIWKQVVPKDVDNSALNWNFLARQFPLSGGNIRSIVFNACLQSAGAGNGKKQLLMREVLIAVKREYDKMNRSLSLEQFGQYAKEIKDLG